jgi:peptidoglycan hydrolase-like protein with peptidoglycan-binding domain
MAPPDFGSGKMMKRRVAFLAAVALSMAASIVPARAQPEPPPKPAASEPDSKKATLLDAQKAAFLEMPEPDRKAAQDALGWLGLYNGVVDGAFGKRTLESILAYQSSVKAPENGVVSTAQLAALKASAQKARAAVGFQIIDDARTGIRIGAPMKLLEKHSSMAAQTQMTSRDGSVSLDLLAPPGAQGSLAALYAKLSAESADRKITYKAMKTDSFFVVAGEQGARKFYLRYGVAPAAAPDAGALRGFEFAYPVAEASELDRVALAIANAFEPFPSSPPPAQSAAGAPLEPGKTPTPVPSPALSEPVLTATALIVAPGQAATVLTEAECRTPSIGGKPVKFVHAGASGLALLGGDFAGAAPSLRLGVGAADVIVLSLAPGNGLGKTVLEASDANLTPISGTREAIVTALSKSARGAPAFDRQGALVAFVAPLSAEPKRLDGVVLAEPHELVGAGAAEGLVTWASAEPAPAAPLGAADIARKMRGAITGVFCTP